MSDQSTIVDANLPEPPDSKAQARRRRRQRRRRVALATVLVLVLGLLGWAGTSYWLQHHRACPGLSGPSGPGFELSMVDGECIGWTDEQDYAFSPDTRDITARIVVLNQLVERRWSAPENGRAPIPYVKVAVLMPMTGDTTSALPTATITNALAGIYTAQARANELERPAFGELDPGVQVVLVNEGRLQQHWTTVVPQLAALRGGEHPLVAVVGMGISIPETRDAAAELSRLGIPSIGAVISSNDMVADRFFKVTPSNKDYASALAAYLETRRDLTSGYLVYDGNRDDNYVRTLRESFEQQFGGQYRLDQRRTAFAGSKRSPEPTPRPTLFTLAVSNICQTQADVIFYAGRERDLPALIQALSNRGACGHDKPIAIMTGSTGLSRTNTPAIHRTLVESRISVIDAASANPTGWGRQEQAPDGYRAFHDYYRNTLHLREDWLADGYAIMHHDALATAIYATRVNATDNPNTPTNEDVYLTLTNLHGTKSVPGASGNLSFDNISNGWPHCKPVPIIQLPATAAQPKDYVTPPCDTPG